MPGVTLQVSGDWWGFRRMGLRLRLGFRPREREVPDASGVLDVQARHQCGPEDLHLTRGISGRPQRSSEGIFDRHQPRRPYGSRQLGNVG